MHPSTSRETAKIVAGAVAAVVATVFLFAIVMALLLPQQNLRLAGGARPPDLVRRPA